jgi:hypothetical protein
MTIDFSLTPEQQDLQARAEKIGRSFADQARGWDESDDAPYREIFDQVGVEGLFGVAMPKEYGGQGGGAVEYLIAVEALFRYAQSWLPPEPVFCTSGPGPSSCARRFCVTESGFASPNDRKPRRLRCSRSPGLNPPIPTGLSQKNSQQGPAMANSTVTSMYWGRQAQEWSHSSIERRARSSFRRPLAARRVP